MAKWCLVPELVTKFKQGLKNGEIDPNKLSQMSSEERNAFLSKYVGKDNALQTNSLFESKLLLKNQKAGYIAWAKKVAGLTPEVRRDLLSKIEKMDRVLSPKEGEQFLKDLASTRLGADITEQEAKQIFELSNKIKDLKSSIPATVDRLEGGIEAGRAKIALSNYVNELKEKSFKEISLNPVKLISSVGGNAKSIKASTDNSAIFRQGWKTLMTHPLTWAKNASKTFSDIYKTFGGKKVMDELNADIISRPTYDLMVKAKLAIGVIEEAFPGTVAEKLPIIGRVYKASENAYTGFLYRQRADIFDKYIQIAQKSGVDLTKKELESIGSMVNSLTGRGHLGPAEPAANVFNNIFFSPRNLKSQFDTIGHVVTGAGGSNFVRKQAAINLLKVVSGTAAILATASAIKPGSVEWDSRSADFGQIKVGNTRFNVSGGLNGLVILASRLITGSTKSSTTGKITPLNSGDFGMPTGTDVVYNFFENKLSPLAGVVRDLLNNKDFDGNVPTIESTAKNLFLPIGFSTYEDLQKDPNSPNKVITMILDGLGIGANTYLPKPKKENSWIEKPTKAQEAFKSKVSETQFKDANAIFNQRFEAWQKEVEKTDIYNKLSDDKKDGIRQSARGRIQDQVFKEYGFTYKEPKKTREDLQLEKELEKVKPKKVSQSLLDRLIPSAYASEGEQVPQEASEGIIDTIIRKVSELFGDKKTEVKGSDKYAAMPDVKMIKNSNLVKETPTPQQEIKSAPKEYTRPDKPLPVVNNLGRNPDVIKKPLVKEVESVIRNAAKEFGVPSELLFDIGFSEGGFYAKSKNETEEGKKADVPEGLYQFRPGTWETVANYARKPNSSLKNWLVKGKPPPRSDPVANARAAAYLIKFGQLGKWQASKPNWGRFYTEDELEKYYSQTIGYKKGETFK